MSQSRSSSLITCYLLRHAHAAYSPDESRGLSSHGRLASLAICDQLVGCGITSIYSSPYLRAVETIRPLGTSLGLPIRLHPGLRERRLASGAVDDFPAAVRASWDDMDVHQPGGESNRQAQTRVIKTLQEITNRQEVMAVSTHGTLLALLLNAFDERYGYAFWSKLKMPDVYRVDMTKTGSGQLQLEHIDHFDD